MALSIIPIVVGIVASTLGLACSSPSKKQEEEHSPNLDNQLDNKSEEAAKALASSSFLSDDVPVHPVTPMRVPVLFNVATEQPCKGSVLVEGDPSIANLCLNKDEISSLKRVADLLQTTRRLNLWDVNELLLDHMQDWPPQIIEGALVLQGAPEGRYLNLARNIAASNRSLQLIIPEAKLRPDKN